MRGIIGVAERQYATPIRFETFGNLYDSVPIVALVESFGLEREATIGVDHVHSKVTEGKILCVSLEGKTTVSLRFDALTYRLSAQRVLR